MRLRGRGRGRRSGEGRSMFLSPPPPPLPRLWTRSISRLNGIQGHYPGSPPLSADKILRDQGVRVFKEPPDVYFALQARGGKGMQIAGFSYCE